MQGGNARQSIHTIDSVYAPQLSNVQLREWQRYNGWKIRILEELEHSGGMTTRVISDRIGYRCVSVANRLQEMLRANLVEKVDRWGWRITVTGVFLLSLNYVPTTYQQHTNIITTSSQQEKEEPAPSCFHAKSCHIKKICQDKRYTSKTMMVCLDCVWNNPRTFHIPALPVEMNAVG